MKFVLVFALFISSNVFAFNICQFQETIDMYDFFKAQNLKAVRIAKNSQNLTSVEKHLVRKTLTQQLWFKNLTEDQALTEFAGGEIEYYNLEGQQIIFVRYWQGDNEFGGFFKINKNGSFKIMATVSYGLIECKSFLP
jgi:hypothetical protein